jgi:multidrug efflux pump
VLGLVDAAAGSCSCSPPWWPVWRWASGSLPSAFLPEEDQGYFMTSIQLPSDATTERTLNVVKAFEAHAASRPGIASQQAVLGFSFSGSGPNAAIIFSNMQPWSERKGTSAAEEVAQAQAGHGQTPEGMVMNLMPPAIEELGTSSGFARCACRTAPTRASTR